KHLKERFMISFQRDEIRGERIVREAIEHPARLWTSIDVVSDRHNEAIAGWIGGQIARNLVGDVIQKIGSAVNVANDVEPPLVGGDQIRNHITAVSMTNRRFRGCYYSFVLQSNCFRSEERRVGKECRVLRS